MSDKVQLSHEDFAKQMFRFGFFYEQIPPCFTSNSFASKHKDVLALLGKRNPVTMPLTISIYKTEESRREISIPNPMSFASTVRCFASNWTKCERFAESPNSHSPITFIHSYPDPEEGFTVSKLINSENHRTHLNARSDFVNNLKERVLVSLGLPYKLSIDIASFYDSIYTHSISWALCGKNEAKRWHAIIENGQKTARRSEKPKNYDLSDQFDKAIRRQKGNETNGIATGPYTSRIFSEMLLCGIDKLLRDGGVVSQRRYHFRRYVDDYSFYFLSEQEAKQGALEIEKALREFGLRINPNKVSIQRYPFDILTNLRERLNGAFEKDGVFGLLNEAALLSADGEKGAYKYALKLLRSKGQRPSDDLDLALLINIGVSRPNCALLALDYIRRNRKSYDEEQLANALSSLINDTLKEGLEQEAINSLYYSLELDISIDGDSIEKSITHGNDLCKIMALDLLAHRPDKINFENTSYESLMEAAKSLQSSLNGAGVDGPRWMLLFECLNHGLLEVDLGNDTTSELFRGLAQNEISFYKGLTEPNFSWVEENIQKTQ